MPLWSLTASHLRMGDSAVLCGPNDVVFLLVLWTCMLLYLCCVFVFIVVLVFGFVFVVFMGLTTLAVQRGLHCCWPSLVQCASLHGLLLVCADDLPNVQSTQWVRDNNLEMPSPSQLFFVCIACWP